MIEAIQSVRALSGSEAASPFCEGLQQIPEHLGRIASGVCGITSILAGKCSKIKRIVGLR